MFDQLAGLMPDLWRAPWWPKLAGLVARVQPSSYRFRPMAGPGVVHASMPGPLEHLEQKDPSTLLVGAAVVDITPPNPRGMNLAGFGFGRQATGVLDPLQARAMAMAHGGQAFVLVGCDLIGLSLPLVERVRGRLGRSHPEAIWLSATHNHQGPDTLGMWGKALAGVLPVRTGMDPGYLIWLEDRLVESVELACENARPAVLRVAQTAFDEEGRWVHNERGPERDRTLRAVFAEDDKGQSIATWFCHACHPETLWKDNSQISADFCGVACREVEARRGGVALYTNGALGAMVSAALPENASLATRLLHMQEHGQALAQAALALGEVAQPAGVEGRGLQVAIERLVLPLAENPLFGWLSRLGIVEERDLSRDLVSQVSLCQLGELLLLGLPGEPSPALIRSLAARLGRSPDEIVWIGLCQDELGYLLTEEQFASPAYRYERHVSPGSSALRLVGRALVAGLERLHLPAVIR